MYFRLCSGLATEVQGGLVMHVSWGTLQHVLQQVLLHLKAGCLLAAPAPATSAGVPRTSGDWPGFVLPVGGPLPQVF